MANYTQIRAGAATPAIGDLQEFQLGYCTGDGLLYIGVPQSGNIVPSVVGSKMSTVINASSTDETAATSKAVYDYAFAKAGGTISGNVAIAGTLELGRTVGGVTNWYQVYHAGMTDIVPQAQGGTGRTDGKVAALVTARKIGDANFDGSANITLAQIVGNAVGFGMAAGNDNTASFGWPIGFGTEEVRKNSSYNLEYLGANLNTFTDTPENWQARGTGWAWYSDVTASSLSNKPSAYGILINQTIQTTNGSDVHQLFLTQSNGAVYHRGGNNSGWSTGWKQMWDSTNLPLPLGISQGGTGQISATGIRNAIGLGNTTGALPIANGGTGVTTLAALLVAMVSLGVLTNSAEHIQTGTVSTGTSGAVVTFSPAFAGTPRVLLTVNNSGSYANCVSLSNTGVTVRANNNATVQWTAIYVG